MYSDISDFCTLKKRNGIYALCIHDANRCDETERTHKYKGYEFNLGAKICINSVTQLLASIGLRVMTADGFRTLLSLIM